MRNDRKFFGFGRNVFFAGLVSFFMDVSSEMIYPLVPLFLANVLGVNKSLIGLIEGIAESTASLLKVFSGWFSDRIGNRKWLMVAGYGISTLSRPIIAFATGWHHVMGSRFIDRFGKGVRTAPRDAIIAESAEKTHLGRAFSFHRSMDTMGAVVGPALAFFFLGIFLNDYRKVFWLSMIPGAIAVLLIILFITEKKKVPLPHAERPKLTLKHFDWKFKFFVLIATLFAIGNSSDVFLILRAQQTGIPTVMIPVVYLLFNLIYSLSSIPAGIAADKFGRKRVILLGFILFAILYYGFAIAKDTMAIWVLFGFYGIFMGLTEGIQKAFLATIIPPDFKATAFGVYNTAVGLAMFPASLIGGWLWDHVSPAATFYFGSITASLSTILFVIFIAAIRRNVSK
ncbi:MAG: MFS transporter [Nitrospirae bacterium CG_4_10_14_0_8_um_filter_41_23]|nr:MFS transporter [Nitrospirota bacterium]PIQ94784.1 MAG: MFS transporter [Nitrospirae bacterium CG11_big_fil_rev_8_21_14_0_20_41_14]PIV42214.1 MAG: MFS transporter [Nitrospirae bacterium CG02_land_8_20_14_3_00_41_53]PIW86957.1 MAG: MFS transporter [Nitrospirae bacterium CG_4_8_14_3_um_filter_41_47]PIY86772.1 MAG: MFS transporter [Nitrospirae bacterium CG_4_10_14_0_8_um_filter_41_23]PJA80851.1 MAG: MFS transporter [Nitrospirae bacterium CG_4_9_14_3_um_filter_41_27]